VAREPAVKIPPCLANPPTTLRRDALHLARYIADALGLSGECAGPVLKRTPIIICGKAYEPALCEQHEGQRRAFRKEVEPA
jgi:hypothetical protein